MMNKRMVLSVAACCAGLLVGCGTTGSKCGMCAGSGTTCASGMCADGGACPAKMAGAEAKMNGLIDTAALETLARAKTPMTVLDARAGKYDAGTRIPGAKALAPDADEAAVAALLPDKQALVVTYCANLKCPASHLLGMRLRKLGYTNVLEYRAGIEGWKSAGNAVEKAGR